MFRLVFSAQTGDTSRRIDPHGVLARKDPRAHPIATHRMRKPAHCCSSIGRIEPAPLRVHAPRLQSAAFRHTCYSHGSISGAKLSHDRRAAVELRFRLEARQLAQVRRFKSHDCISPERTERRKDGQPAMHTPPVMSPQAWEAARKQPLVKEKAQTRARDALAAERRRMPWEPGIQRSRALF